MLNVTLGVPRRHRSLTVFPLLAPDAPELPYSLMSDALAAGVLRITEVGSGTVPELYAVNSGSATILVLDGEQLVGARQNRTTNRSLLLAAGSKTNIPVSCMEQGRWHFSSDHFQPTTQSSPSGVRRQAREVEAGYVASGAAVPPPAQALSTAQGRVWETIADLAAHSGGPSDTGALDHVYEARGGDVDEFVLAFPVEPSQVGLLAFLGGAALGVDVIGSARLYARLHERIIRGYAMDALGSSARPRKVGFEAAQAYLDAVSAAPRLDSPTVGIGRYSVLSGEVIGGELTDAGAVVHLSAFPASPRQQRGPGSRAISDPIAPPSRRRRSS